MCSYRQTSVDEPCSITYPRDIHVETSSDTSDIVRLTCNTSCALTEPETQYMWYHNRSRNYRNQNISINRSAKDKFSCAVKDHEYLQSPEVCVQDKNCWRVNYVSRRICALEGSSVNITKVHIMRTAEEKKGSVTLTCNTSCNLTYPQTAYIWYRNRESYSENQHFIAEYRPNLWNWGPNVFCAVKSNEYLLSAEVCVHYEVNCSAVNYVSRRICALEGSSVNITSEYSHPDNMKPKFKCWSKKWRKDKVEVEELIESAGRVEYQDNMKNQHILTINNLKKNDSGGYTFRFNKDHEGWTQSDLPGVFLIVTELRVKMSPSAVVTEGQRVTLTCSTSCPLTDNTNYIWYLNSRPLTPRENQNKHLILDPVSREDAGSYSCAVKTNKDISSAPKTLTVQSITGTWTPAAAGVSAALLLLILLTVFWCVRKKRTSSQPPRRETSDNKQQMNPDLKYENISAQSAEQDDHHYSRLHFSDNHTADLYSTIEPLPAH
uniref:Ig-like domain-containing protein n=1 Tax=Oreochromis aureus TaxID=47969 RepID=A0AAZ1X7I1_OREAU